MLHLALVQTVLSARGWNTAAGAPDMRVAFDLWSCDEVRPHAADILDRVRSGSMPCDTTWLSEWVDAVQRWVDTEALP